MNTHFHFKHKAFGALLAAFLVSGPSVWAQERQTETTGITVQGTGEVRIKPDIAQITLGVQTQNSNASEAAAQNAALTQRVMQAIRGAGVAERDIQTANFSINPQYDNNQQPSAQFKPPTIQGYQVDNQVRLTVRRIDAVGQVIDAAIKAGANVAGGIAFDLDNPTTAREEALRKAVADAMNKAKIIGVAAGAGPLRLLSIVEGGFEYPRPMPYAAMRGAMAMEAATPVAPGEQTITVSVTARYGLAN